MPESPQMDWLERVLSLAPRPDFRARLKEELQTMSGITPAAEPASRVRRTAAPQIRVRDVAAAIDFYARAFGARETMRFEVGGRIPHAEITIGDSLVILGEESIEYGYPSAEHIGASPVAMHLLVDDADAVTATAVAAGARLLAPVAMQFYGDRSGRVADPFGYSWTIAARVEDLTVEEMHRRMAALQAHPPAPAPASFTREGFRTVTPYIVAQDAPGLIDFVGRVFGGEELSRAIGSAGGVHAEVRIGDSMVMIGGGAPDLSWRGDSKPSAFHLYVPDTDTVFARAVEAGATVIHPPADMEYGERSGGVKDAWGNCWYIATSAGPRYVPEGLATVNVYLHPVRAEPVLAFLSRAFGAEQLEKYATPDGVVHHAQVRIGDSVVEMGEAHGPFQPMPTMFFVYVPSVDASFERATAAGASAMHPPGDQPYGDRTAAVKDPFGNEWYLATRIRA